TELKLAAQEIRTWVREILAEGQQTGEMAFAGSVESKADAVIGSLLAALIMNRAVEEDVLEHIIEQIQITL
ncbi:MAG: hypothetical protein AAFV07_17995, partial [Bacteroidota bacterium]